MSQWSAAQYSLFEDARTRPARDLAAAIPVQVPAQVVDLGCGPGNSTEVLAARWPGAALLGLDNAPDMIRAARERMPQARFELADIAQWRAETPADVIFANAALQWVPDHAQLYPRLLAQLVDGGWLAVQTPDNLDEPAHRVARALAGSAQWSSDLGGVRLPDRHDARWYYALLAPLCRRVEVWRTTYFHPLPNHDAVVEWFKGSALGPYLACLDAAAQTAFLHAYRAGITEAMPVQPDGSVLLPFPRLFVVAQR